MSPGEFCRDIETYLCRKNEGHLIRIVGPVFEKVCGWAAQGVPIKIAYRGIDRYVERQQAKNPGPRRRPIRVEFCEADILDAFDEWRRAVGVTSSAVAAAAAAGASSEANAAETGGTNAAGGPGASRSGVAGSAERGDAGDAEDGHGHGHAKRRAGLQTHIDRVMARLTQRRMDSGARLGEAIDRVLGELDTMRAGARGARSDARTAVIDRLTAIDRDLMTAAREALDPTALEDLRREAARELGPFRSRMPADAFRETSEAALERLIRERWRLPSLRPDA
jgi:hypothetical protein